MTRVIRVVTLRRLWWSGLMHSPLHVRQSGDGPESHCEVLSGWQARWLMTTGCGAALQLDASSARAHHRWWQIGQRGRVRVLSLSLCRSLCLLNKTLTSTPWLPPLCLTSGHNAEPSASNSDRSVKATQMAWTHPSSGPVTQSLLYFLHINPASDSFTCLFQLLSLSRLQSGMLNCSQWKKKKKKVTAAQKLRFECCFEQVPPTSTVVFSSTEEMKCLTMKWSETKPRATRGQLLFN